MGIMRKAATTAAMTGALLLAAGPALAYQCVNVSKKNTQAGVGIVLASDFDTTLWASPQVEARFANGTIDPDTGEGFHGQLGVDFTGDAVADVAIYINIGPDGQIPQVAQDNGAECAGIVHLEDYFECLGLVP